MLSSQAAGAAGRAGASYLQSAALEKLSTVDDEQSNRQSIDVVLWDLACGGDSLAEVAKRIGELAPGARIVAYAPHVHEDRLAAAQAAGCHEVLSRGQFVRNLPRLCSAAQR